MTQTAVTTTGSWSELLGPKNLGACTVLAGGVALYATNEFLTVSLMPSAVAEIGGSGRNASRGRRAQGEPGRAVSAGIIEGRDTTNMPRAELADLIKDLTEQMMAAARDLQFELAARIRDEIHDLKKELRGMDAAGLK